MSDNTQITIYDTSVDLGEKKTIMLPMPKLYDWTPLTMPVHVIRGKKPGPTLCITAAIHGDEVNGVEIIRRILKKSVLKHLHGTLIAIPIVNVYGFLYQSRYLMDRRDLNRSFPGSSKGSLAARLAHLLVQEVISKATHVIDLHAGSLLRTNFPQVRTNIDSPEIHELAIAFNAPVILHASLRDGSLRQYANENNIPLLVYEAGEALRFDDIAIKTGVNGILNIMHYLQMIKLKNKILHKITPELARNSYWVRAPQSGVLLPNKKLGKRVEKGELLAKIGNPTGTKEHDLKSPLSGIIIGKSNSPMVHEGAALFHIASFHKLEVVEGHIETLQETYGDDRALPTEL